MQAKEIKTGMIVNYEGQPCLIETVSVQSASARGAATQYKFRARNVITKQKTDIVLRGGEGLDEADFMRRPVKYMYSDPGACFFLDDQDYNTHSLPREAIEHEMQFVTDGLEGILLLIYNDQPVGIQLPTAVELAVVETEPSAKGNSATSRTKPAKLETGLVVQAPEYIEVGEKLKIDTRNGEFLSRA